MYSITNLIKRKYFIDCGGNNGSSVRKFRKEIDPKKRYEIFTFEPNLQYFQDYCHFEKHNLLPYAVWIENGEQSFFLDYEDGDGSTLIKEKLTADEGGIGVLDKTSPLKVKSVDFSSWLKRNFSKNDHIILKLDIEGAEYKVLEKMIKDGTVDYINQLYIEWHWFKIGLPEEAHNKIISQLKDLKMPIYDWDAQV